MVSYVTAVALALLATLPSSRQQYSSSETFGSGLAKEAVAVKTPIEEAVVSAASSQCSKVKRLLGVDYDQIKEEPNLNELTLDYIVPGKLIIKYNLSTAAEDIPKTKEFDYKKKLYIINHGYTDDPTKVTTMTITAGLFSIGDCNVFALNSSSLIGGFYLRAATYTKFIGGRLGRTMAAFTKYGTDPKRIHLIGHSLGAHIAGNAGKKFFKLTGVKLGRISGLDPAGPCFSPLDPKLRLNASDADFVDVIHTDVGVLGIDESLGHVDFYPNGGNQQPGCVTQSCNHGFVWMIFTDTIEKPNSCPAVECKSWDDFRKGRCGKKISYMGFGCSNDTRGTYYLQTNGESPYGRGLKGLTFQNTEGVLRTIKSNLTP